MESGYISACFSLSLNINPWFSSQVIVIAPIWKFPHIILYLIKYRWHIRHLVCIWTGFITHLKCLLFELHRYYTTQWIDLLVLHFGSKVRKIYFFFPYFVVRMAVRRKPLKHKYMRLCTVVFRLKGLTQRKWWFSQTPAVLNCSFSSSKVSQS